MRRKIVFSNTSCEDIEWYYAAPFGNVAFERSLSCAGKRDALSFNPFKKPFNTTKVSIVEQLSIIFCIYNIGNHAW